MTIAYRFFVTTLLLALLYLTYGVYNKSITREVLVEEINSAQNNIIGSLSDYEKPVENNEKTVVEVLKNQESKVDDNIINTLKKIEERLSDQQKQRRYIEKFSLKYGRKITADLSKIISRKNLISAENTEGQSLQDKGREFFSKFITVRKIEDIKNDPNLLLKKRFNRLPELLLSKKYGQIAGMFEEAGEILNEGKYSSLAEKIRKFDEKYGSYSTSGAIKKIIREIEK